MRMIRKLVLILVAIIVLFAVIGLFLPRKPHVEREIVISAPPAVVYGHVNNPKSFNQWSPWARIDPDIKYEYTGPEFGQGSGMRWQSDHASVGSGSWTITEAVENESVDMDLDLGDQGVATSFFRLQPQGAGTRITWGFDMDAGLNPITRWFGLMIDQWVGTDYEKGLANLKAQIESDQ